eukprot:TRINITY_DN7847_c0_g1_i1.p1 TRINITY_DN7847_c0_g1~~TRINITY_DN7847_c0_g1_i1.p1  ORF type:complete len:389 (+),score=56.17 TRINITY_DN7847_c0_g1_i1:27-1193(+)
MKEKLIQTTIVLFIALLIGLFLYLPVIMSQGESGEALLQTNFTLQKEPPPNALALPYAFGRYAQGLQDARLRTSLSFSQSFLQYKEWHYFGVHLSDNRYLGVAVGQLQYLSSAFVYLFDPTVKNFSMALTQFPLGFGAEVAPSPFTGCSLWEPWRILPTQIGQLSICPEGLIVAANLDDGQEITARLRISKDGWNESFALIYPNGPEKPAYTNKYGGWSASGSIQRSVNGTIIERSQEIEGTVVGDFTRGLLARRTRWYWTALSFTTVSETGKKVTVACQLSQGSYRDQNGDDLENVLWADGQMEVLKVNVKYHGKYSAGPVHIEAEDGSLKLVYQYSGIVPMEGRYGIIDAALLHTVGVYSGFITVHGVKYPVDNTSGVLEDHVALW